MLSLQDIVGFILFVIAITIHEASHAWMANRLGDPTPKLMGRLTLNPIPHIDLYGTILLPFFLKIIGSSFIFGWAKPVVFDPYNLKNPRKDSALISLAGPASNFLLAILSALVIRVFGVSYLGAFIPILIQLVFINVLLAVFNLIPIHPLDGGKIFVGFLPEKDAKEADLFLKKYGTIILLILIFPLFGGRSPVSSFLSPVISFFMNLLVPQSLI